MNGISDLFSLKQIAFFNKNNEDKILAVEGTDGITFGTSKGKIFRFQVKDDDLVVSKNFNFQSGSVVQLCSVIREDLLLAVRNKALVHVVHSSLTPLIEIGPGTVELVAINRKFESPQLVLFALATNKKQIQIYKGLLTDEGLQLEIIEKIATSGNVIQMCFDGKALCYATNSRYYVLDMTVQPRVHHELIEINESVSPHIVCVGPDDFAICGPDGLIVFVRSDGTSFRPPIDLHLQVVDMMFVDPVLYVIGPSIMVAYNILDESQKITLPCENLQFVVHTADQLILVSNEKRVFKLTLIDTYVERIKEALKESVGDGMQLIRGLCAIYPQDAVISDTCSRLLLEESLEQLNSGDSATGLKLFLKTGANPKMVLSRIKRLNTNKSANLIETDLDSVEMFMDQLLCDDKFSEYTKVVHSYLIRVKILKDTIEFNDVDQTFIEDEELKNWLLENNFHSLLAEFYFEFDRVADALATWKEYASNATLTRQQFEPLTNRLLDIIKSGENNALLTDTLTWLVPLMPEVVMDIVKQMPILDFDWLANAFEAHPQLLLSSLEERAEDKQEDSRFNVQMVKVYVKILEENPNDWKVRNSLRNFLTTILFCDDVANTIPNNKEFNPERLLYTTTAEIAESSIKKLANEDLDAAEILYVKFSDQQPYLIKFLIPKYVKEDKSGRMQERLLKLLCQIRPFHGIEQIISELPSSYLTRDMIALFQSAVKEYSQSRSSIHLQLAIEKLAKENELQSQREKELVFHRFTSSDLCSLCRDALLNESITFQNNQAVHTRCLRKQL